MTCFWNQQPFDGFPRHVYVNPLAMGGSIPTTPAQAPETTSLDEQSKEKIRQELTALRTEIEAPSTSQPENAGSLGRLESLLKERMNLVTDLDGEKTDAIVRVEEALEGLKVQPDVPPQVQKDAFVELEQAVERFIEPGFSDKAEGQMAYESLMGLGESAESNAEPVAETQEEAAPVETSEEEVAAAVQEVTKNEESKGEESPGVIASAATGFAALGASLSKLFGMIGEGFTKLIDKIKGWLGWKKPEEEEKQGEMASNAPEKPTPLDIPQNPDWDSVLDPEKLKDVRSKPTWPARILAAANLAYEQDIDCATEDGNHCSGWVDTVFDMVGLDMYAPEHRVYVSPNYHKNWDPKGTISGLELQPGDSIIRENRTTGTKHHQEIVLSSSGPDAEGNYNVTTLGQIKANEDAGTGEREIRTFDVHADKIKVVIRVA